METNKKMAHSTVYKRFRNTLLFLTGMATGFSFCHLFGSAHHNHTGNGAAVVAVPVAKNPAVLQGEVAASQKATDRRLSLAEQKSSQLKQQLRQSETALKDAKERNHRLQVQLYQTFERADTVPVDSTVLPQPAMPANLLEMLDTLAAVGAEKDLLHDDIVNNMQLQLDNKDSVISVKDRHIGLLKQDFDLSIASQQLLTEENRRLGKKIKWQRFVGKVKSAGLLVLSGLALKSLIY